MTQELDVARNVYLDRDREGVVRGLLHFNAPFGSSAATPQLVASEYLASFSDLLGLEAAQLAALGQAPGTQITKDGIEYRFLLEKAQPGVITVAYQQTVLSLPIWEAGLAVQIQTDPFRVLSSQSTRHPEVSVKPPTQAAIKRAEGINEAELAVQLGLGEARRTARVARELTIQRRQLVVYQFERLNRFRDRPVPKPEEPVEIEDFQAPVSTAATLPLPPLPDTLKDGQHYVCVRVDFGLNAPEYGGRINWVALLEVQTLAVVYVRAFADDVSGLVFNVEPATDNGGPLPNATSTQLNPVRVSKTLLGLDAPDGNNVQHLSGDTVTIVDVESPVVAPPTEPAGTDFNFDARTNDFAAMNAYFHCDEFFRLCDGMGFSRASFFGGTTFPVSVDHRGFGGTGVTVNAHCLGNAGGNGIGVTAFALADTADTTDPIGIACDYRIVLHELGGHGVLYNHVNSANFGFSHSAGDSVGVVLCDPGSQAVDRFETFPWVNASIARRQDRTATGGWGWSGQIALNPFSGFDPGGYNNEQILSSSHFRLYRSIGGDSTDLSTQQFASRVAVYLILKAISTLTPTTNPANASAWVTALLTADGIDWTSENITGSAYSKVIRWAFEKQGLFQSQGQATPNNLEGDPPAVDVYIDDGRGGEYPYQPVFWENTNIWNRTAADGGTAHQDPIIGQTNYAYVKIKNRGTQDATNVVVKGYHANPAAGLSFPNDWLPMTTAQLSAPNVAANNGAEITVGPFEWVPFHLGHECVIMIVSATGDASNVDNIHAGDLIPDWRLIPNDNNIGQRNVAPVAGGGGTTGVTEEFDGLEFELKNPLTKQATMRVSATLPPLLVERGWKLEFRNRGGASFPLRPGESRNVVMRMVAGAPFETSDIEQAQERTIHVAGYAGGILVGGLSYVLDPALKHPTRRPHKKRHRVIDECERTAEGLVDCLEVPENVSRVRVRKITVDIEFEEDC
jgi:hypothetical protein